jgi:iron complex transport system substrate-binding protein
MQFAPPAHVAALSPDAGKDFSYLRARANGVATVRPRVEDVLALRPTVVVRSFGGDAGIDAALVGAGVEVVQLGYPQTLSDVRAELLRVGGALGAAEQAEAMAGDFDARLAALPPAHAKPSALYMTPGGVTTGGGSLIDEMMTLAGLANFEASAGWSALPLERLASQRPDIIVAAFYGETGADSDQWSAARHPIAAASLRGRPVAKLSGASVSCGAWYVLDAVEAMADTRVTWEAQRGERAQ